MKRRAIALIILPLVLGVSLLLWNVTISPAVGLLVDQQTNASNSFSTASCFPGDTGFRNPTAEAADTGGDGNGLELNPTNAFLDDAAFASNMDGPGDRHRFSSYGFTIGSTCAIKGIEVRLDWWVDATGGGPSISIELSWDGGTSWTALKTTTSSSTTEITSILGSSTDTWGRTWTPGEFSDANFRVRLTSNGPGPRDFFLDWVPVKVYKDP